MSLYGEPILDKLHLCAFHLKVPNLGLDADGYILLLEDEEGGRIGNAKPIALQDYIYLEGNKLLYKITLNDGSEWNYKIWLSTEGVDFLRESGYPIEMHGPYKSHYHPKKFYGRQGGFRPTRRGIGS